MKRIVLVSGLVLCVVVAFAVRSSATSVANPSYLVDPGNIYEVSFCGGRAVAGISEGYPIALKITKLLSEGWVEAEWSGGVTEVRGEKVLMLNTTHGTNRFNLNVACAVTQPIK